MRKLKYLDGNLWWTSSPILIHLLCLLICLVLFACTRPSADITALATSSPTIRTPQSRKPATPRQVETPAPPTLMIQPTETESKLLICSPFPDHSFAELEAAINNPFNPPPPGSDDPHQGVDLAIQQNGLALAGGEVQAVLNGVVAARIPDRFPYGNALLVESPLGEFSPAQLEQLALPTPAPTLSPHPALTCPSIDTPLFAPGEKRSLYLLYAHLQEAVDIQPGGAIRCGQLIGQIGQSGNALNPHLHMEVRVGPAGARFSSLAHYTASASAEEMSNYCLWRVSGLFQLVNPMRLLEKIP